MLIRSLLFAIAGNVGPCEIIPSANVSPTYFNAVTIGGFIIKAVDKIEDKVKVIDLSKIKVDITDDQDSIHINSDSNKKNKTKERVLIIIDNDTIVNIQKNN